MRIGVVPASARSAGGSFQHSLAFLDLLGGAQSADEFVVFHEPVTDLPLSRLNASSFETVATTLLAHRSVLGAVSSWAVNGADRVLNRGAAGRVWRRARRSLSRSTASVQWSGDIDTIAYRTGLWHRLFRRHRVERMIYLGVMECAFETDIPYVMAIHDLLHRFHPELPEAFVHGPPAYYEYLHRNATRHATVIVVDSETGKEDVLAVYGSYGLTANRVKVLPLLPAPYLRDTVSAGDLRDRYRLPERYLFYPARFWPHKNHARLLEALRLLKRRHHLAIPLVLVGFDVHDPPQRGEIAVREMRALSQQLGLEDQIHYVGVVPDHDMGPLYAGATALVMPTFGGPSNIPVVEAWQLGCAVLTSDMRGTRDQAGDAALLVDPSSVEALADGIYRLWTDAALRRELVQRGSDRLASETRQQHVERLGDILDAAKSRPKVSPRP